MLKQYIFKAISAWIIITCLAILACSESQNGTDGDTDNDTELSEVEADPCEGVDCSPGTCEIQYGYAKCNCPDGYEISGYSCIKAPDGDEETDIESDLDEDLVDTEENLDGDTDVIDTDDGIPQCTTANDVFPCRMSVSIDGPDESGLFYINSGYVTYGLDVWENWVVFVQGIIESDDYPAGGGILLFNYETKEVIKLAHQFNSDLYPVINDGYVAWAEENPNASDADSENKSRIFTLNVETMEKKLISNSSSDKLGLEYEFPYVYWLDKRQKLGQFGHPIYSVDDEGNEIRIDTQTTGEGAADFSVSENIIAYVTGTGQMGVIDRENITQRLLDVPSKVYYRTYPELYNGMLYYQDNRDEPSGNPESTRCYQSIYKYDLENDKETVIKQNTEGKDFRMEDAWGDWLLYSYYNETNYGTEDPSLKYCALNAADGDLFLKYLPTGEEWNITNHLGNQHRASMWGPLVVWHDTREDLDPIYGFGEFYGLDLCMHPELKTRFTECVEREAKNAKKR